LQKQIWFYNKTAMSEWTLFGITELRQTESDVVFKQTLAGPTTTKTVLDPWAKISNVIGKQAARV
jgi:hypothetical protein